MSGLNSNGCRWISAAMLPSSFVSACCRLARPTAHHGQATSETKSMRSGAGLFMAVEPVCICANVEAVGRMSMSGVRPSIAEIHRNAQATLPGVGMSNDVVAGADVELHALRDLPARACARDVLRRRFDIQSQRGRGRPTFVDSEQCAICIAMQHFGIHAGRTTGVVLPAQARAKEVLVTAGAERLRAIREFDAAEQAPTEIAARPSRELQCQRGIGAS